ncbi:hypothetical protein [Roseateles sp.]|uniref:hypothetical protein n=1 Tax=Roseateles sp. TaxID=1971397 RepID=UPI0039E75E8E
MRRQLAATRLWTLCAIATSAALAGCANGYSKFYQPVQGIGAGVRAQPSAGAPGELLIERLAPAAELQQQFAAYERRGYVLIGSSAFNSDQRQSEMDAIAQGRRIGADLVVIMTPRYTGSTTGAIPIRAPASDRHSPVTSFGTGNDVTFGEDNRPRTYGTQAANVTVAVHHMDFGAGYFVKRR